MLNLTTEELKKMLTESDKKKVCLELTLESVNERVKKLHQEGESMAKKIKVEQKRSEAIRKALTLARGVPSKVSQARNQLLRKMERVGREDITIAESKNLRTEIETLKAELQKICSHPFLYEEPGYEGSYSHDYENRHPCVRYCVVCGFSEDSYNVKEVAFLKKEYFFKTLIPDENRIIESQPWTSEGRKRLNFWTILGLVLKPFEESVAKVLNSK